MEKRVPAHIGPQPCADHKGNHYESHGEMLAAYNMTPQTFSRRTKHGMTAQEALETPVPELGCLEPKPCKDHRGNEYPSKTAMAKAYGLTLQTLNSRLRAKKTLEEALETPLDHRCANTACDRRYKENRPKKENQGKEKGQSGMILSDGEIMEYMKWGRLSISPLDKSQIQPASVDIRIGNTFCVLEDTPDGIIRLDSRIKYKQLVAEEYLLLPGQFVLATTVEYFELPSNLTAFVEGRSSLGRLGLFIQNAGWVDPGFHGEITLELFNANRCAIMLKAGHRVGQLVFARMEKEALHPYNGKYQGQTTATGSRIYMDFEKQDQAAQRP